MDDFRKGVSFEHENESAKVGSYDVKLDEIGVEVSLTAGEQSAIHRYTFLGENPKSLLIDISSVNGSENYVENTSIEFDKSRGVFKGFVTVLDSFSRSYGGFKIYFCFKFNQIESYYFFNSQEVVKEQKASGKDLGMVARLPKHTKQAEISFGFSLASTKEAIENFKKAPTFDIQKKETIKIWESLLSRILVESNDKGFLELFYTSLYHALLMPNLASSSSMPKYTNFSLWDTFRTTHPLFNLAFKDYQRMFIDSLINLTDSRKKLPRWPYQTGETDIMIGSPSAIVISEAAQTSLRDLGLGTYSVVLNSMLNDKDLSICLEKGFCPGDQMTGSVSKAIEYSWAFHSLKKWHPEDSTQKFPANGTELWKAHWHPEEKVFLPKDSSGSWIEDNSYWLFSVFGGKHYTEGSKNHWLWGISHKDTVKELISLFGSEEKFISSLNDFLDKGADNELGAMVPSAYYWHGNEHNLHAPFLFNFTSRPFLTQKWVSWILRNRYKIGPHGLDGNDDAGTLGAWFVWASLGLFPLPGTSMLTITSPLIDDAKIALSKDKLLTISVTRESEGAEYIKSVYLDERQICEPFISFDDLQDSKKLTFQLTVEPDALSGFNCDGE